MKHSKRHFSFVTSVVESLRVPLIRLVPVLNDTHRLSRIIFQLLHVSPQCDQYIKLNSSIFLLSLILLEDRDHGISGPYPLLSSIESICAIAILNVCTFTIKASLIQSFREIFSLFCRGPESSASRTTLSRLPQFCAPLPPDSHPSLCCSCLQLNQEDQKPGFNFQTWPKLNILVHFLAFVLAGGSLGPDESY